MTEDAKQLLQRISCSAHVHLCKEDERNWGKEGYTVKSGYKHLLEDSDIPPSHPYGEKYGLQIAPQKSTSSASSWPTTKY